jgi:hypothetical protein
MKRLFALALVALALAGGVLTIAAIEIPTPASACENGC